MYLSEVIFNWPCIDCEGTGVEANKMARGHELWRHAQSRLKNDPNEFERVDCITSLKRAVNARLKTIESEYHFHALPSLRNKKMTLEKYQDYGLIRPTLIKDLFEVRNLLEHEDVKPPKTSKCQYYVDIVWYFLKSLDSLLTLKSDVIVYEYGNSELFVRADNEWNFSFYGDINENLISQVEKVGFIEVDDLDIKKFEDRSGLVKVTGKFMMHDKLKIKLAREYFGAVGYWYEDHA